jgi:hypothetical protein
MYEEIMCLCFVVCDLSMLGRDFLGWYTVPTYNLGICTIRATTYYIASLAVYRTVLCMNEQQSKPGFTLMHVSPDTACAPSLSSSPA